MLYCDIEDLGNELSVKFGPFQGFLCYLGDFVIPYTNIKCYHDPSGCCEGCGGYGIGKINKCSGGAGGRQHSLCSCCCGHKQIVIEFKSTKSLCAYGYDKITISVNGDHYQSFRKLLDEKLGVITSNNYTDQTANI